jgi:hypothetical protein
MYLSMSCVIIFVVYIYISWWRLYCHFKMFRYPRRTFVHTGGGGERSFCFLLPWYGLDMKETFFRVSFSMSSTFAHLAWQYQLWSGETFQGVVVRMNGHTIWCNQAGGKT